MDNSTKSHEGHNTNSNEVSNDTLGFSSLTELQQGAETLAKTGFEQRHNIVEKSFDKARQHDEKQIGKSGAERRNAAYIKRLEDLVGKYGNEAEKKLWEASSKKLIVNPEDIPEAYWKQQDQRLRDEGYGNHHYDQYWKEKEIAAIQEHQRETLKDWSNYLGSKESPYPMWFKVYAWDGMSQMGTYDKPKKEYSKRTKGSVAPYPEFNAETLAKIWQVVNDFYDNPDSEYYSEDEKHMAQMKALVKSGNFRKLYSYIDAHNRIAPEVPDNPEDVHGEWIEYNPHDVEKLADVTNGTGLCIAAPRVGRSYFVTGHYGSIKEYDGSEKDSKAKFYILQLHDPETGLLADQGCASVRLDPNGNVAEISGLRKGQALHDSLVPTVEEKVKSLPGGERFLEAFADKQMLIALDHKMQNAEPLTKEEYEFIYELNHPIKTLDTYNDEDPRIPELREKYNVKSAFDIGIDAKRFTDQLLKNGQIELIAGNLNDIIAAGVEVDPSFFAQQLAQSPRGLSTLAKYIDQFKAAGVNINPNGLVERLSQGDEQPWKVVNHLDKLLAAGAKIDLPQLANQLVEDDKISPLEGYYIDKLVSAGLDPDYVPNRLIEQGKTRELLDNLNKFTAAGAKIDLPQLANQLMENNDVWEIAWHLDEFLAAGAKIDLPQLAAQLKQVEDFDSLAYHLDKFVAAGADIDPIQLAKQLIENVDIDAVSDNFDKFVAAGADRKALKQILNQGKLLKAIKFGEYSE